MEQNEKKEDTSSKNQENPNKVKKKKKPLDKRHHHHISIIIPGLMGILSLVLILNVYLTFDIQRSVTKPRIIFVEPEEKPIKEPNLAVDFKGKITATIIRDSECSMCFDPQLIISSMADVGGKVENVVEIDKKDIKGVELIEKYGITKLPTVLFSKEALDVPNMKKMWQDMGAIAEDDTLVYTRLFPPYYDVIEDGIKGLVEITYLIDPSCEPCYDVTKHKSVLDRFSITVINEKLESVNTPEGKQLLEKYDIKKIPTIILSPDVSIYPSFTESWKDVGSIEADGSYIFRTPDVIPNATYINLETETVVTVE